MIRTLEITIGALGLALATVGILVASAAVGVIGLVLTAVGYGMLIKGGASAGHSRS